MKFAYRLLITSALCLLFALLRANSDEKQEMITTAEKYAMANDCFSNNCSALKPECLNCNFNYSCVYGDKLNATCELDNKDIISLCRRKFTRTYLCAFCYQLHPRHYDCSEQPCQMYSRTKTMCTVHDDVLCLGNRKFYKFVRCEYQSGYKWSTTLLLSITLGGFGVDRFYLGNWQEGIGKLFSFGGLGIWTLIDVILIATGYLKPNDGSIYI